MSAPYVDLGAVSAYAAAKEGGYTGTEAEFQTALANIGGAQPLLTPGQNIAISGNVIGTRAFPCNPNLLDNWYFGRSVNQRGQTSYVGVGYGLDRWYTTGATLTAEVTAEGVKLYKNAASANPGWAQALETADIEGMTATASLLYKGNGAGARLRFGSADSHQLLLENVSDWTLAQKTFTVGRWGIGSLTDRVIVAVQCFADMAANAPLYIKGIKLELGTEQTLAHQESDGSWALNEIPDYGTQLLRCQRYFQRYATQALRPAKAEDCRPVMRSDPAQSTMTAGGVTYYVNSAEL